MSVIYEFDGITIEPDLDALTEAVKASDMDDTDLEWLRWDQDVAELDAAWARALSEADQSKLAALVAATQGE